MGIIKRFFGKIERGVEKDLGNTTDNITERLSRKSAVKLGIKVKKIMQKPVFISEKATKKQMFEIARKNLTANVFIIADSKKRFKGDVHENDLFLMMIPNDLYDENGMDLGLDLEKKFFAKTARELMRRNDVYCYEDDDIVDAALILSTVEVNEMPVLNKNSQVVGVITESTLLRYLKNDR